MLNQHFRRKYIIVYFQGLKISWNHCFSTFICAATHYKNPL